jgi:glutamyl-tRNA synthetase
VQGEVKVDCRELDDMVLLRSDGTPTYMLAVVVDDHDMGVTHVVRGDDHFNNAFRQLPIYMAMDWSEPEYAHVPLIFSEDGKKLSKRTGAAGVEEYQAMGIPADAMLNYLARLGWGHGDDEIFTMEQAAKWFDLKDIGRAPARINAKKLRSISSHYIKGMDSNQLFVYIWQRSQADRLDIASKVKPEQIIAIVDALKPRSANLNELYDGASFLWATRPLPLDEKAQEKIVDAYVKDLWNMFLDANWDHDGLEAVVHRYLEEHPGMKLIDVATSLRAALLRARR